MDFRKVRRWVSNPFGNKTDRRRFHRTRRASADDQRRNTISLDETPIIDHRSIDSPRPAPIVIPQTLETVPADNRSNHQMIPPEISEPLETPTPAAPPNSPAFNPEGHFQFPIGSPDNLQAPSRSHGYKTKFSGKIKRMKGMLIGDWEMQLRGEMQLLDGEAEITAYRLLKHGYQLNEIVCG